MGAGDLGAGDGRGAGVRMDLQHRSDLPLSGLDQAVEQVAVGDNSMPHRVPTMFRDLTGIRFAWITGDSVYGADHAIRRWAERHRRGYVLAVTSKQYLAQRPVTSWIKRLPRKAWQRLSAGDGTKGPRLYDWTCIPYSGAAPGFQSALLVRRSI